MRHEESADDVRAVVAADARAAVTTFTTTLCDRGGFQLVSIVLRGRLPLDTQVYGARLASGCSVSLSLSL